MRYESWGRCPRARQDILPLRWENDQPRFDSGKRYLPFGNGRSYGDSCLNDKGVLLDARGLDRFIAFDPASGLLRCEAGVLLGEILDLVVSKGWFLPVTPGTKFVTVGGAIASDVHGKNHHRAGTFGRHVRRFALSRSDGSVRICSADSETELFRATIGGLGLTGLILWAELRLKPISNPSILMETVRFHNIDEFLALSKASDEDFEYTVSWIDCVSRGRSLGRGLFMRGNHASADFPALKGPKRNLTIPFELPFSAVNALSLRLFNTLYYRKQRADRKRALTHYDPFFYPLDGILHWNRMYGRSGFFQYQCQVPWTNGRDAISEILCRIAASGFGSFLAVLKVFGDKPSPGLLSFPRPGITLALDFPNDGRRTLELLDSLDKVVSKAGGSVYPAKDARMSAEKFQVYFPQWKELERHRDPAFSSSFWRRVTGGV